jgi:hypothetical protein
MHPILIVVVLGVATSLIGACASSGVYSQPYALFEPDRRSAVEDTRPAFVLKIDDTNVSIDSSEPVPPGMRTVEVSIPGMPGMSNPERDTLVIDARPCTRYLLAARRSSRTASDWKAFVVGTEPIGECAKRFPAKQ